MIATIYIALDGGSRAGWGESVVMARQIAYEDAFETMVNLYGKFRVRTDPKEIEECGPTTWTDGEDQETPEKLRKWARRLPVAKVVVTAESRARLIDAVAALLDCSKSDARRILKQLEVSDGG